MLTTLRRIAVIGGVVATLLISGAATAYAGFGDPVNCTTDPTNPSCVITITTSGGSTSGASAGCRDGNGQSVPCYIKGKGWFGGGSCWYQRATGDDLQAAIALAGQVSPPAYWYIGSCGDPNTNFWPAGMVRFDVFTSDPGLTLLAQEAVKHLSLPAPQIHTSPDATLQVVYVPTWLWVDAADYTAQSATASLAGLSVTAVATPTSVTWSTGDGATVTCGKGTAWSSRDNPADASPDCGHTYTIGSKLASGGAYALTATITWSVTWTGGGTNGTEPALTSTSTTQIRVAETSAVNTD